MLILSQKKEIFCYSTMNIVKSDVYNFSRNYDIGLEAWERDFVYLLEFDNEVVKYYEKPIILFNKIEEYIPSFLVKYHSMDKKDELIFLERDINFNKGKLLDEFCLENGIDLKIFLEEDYKKGYKLMNLKFLSTYMKADINNITVYINFFLELFINSNFLSINDIIDRHIKEKQKKAEVLYVILHLISRNFFLINMNERITTNSLLSLNKF